MVNLFLGGEDRRVAWLVNNITEPVGTLFLRLLLMAVAPLVFSSLVVGDMTAATYVARSEGYELFSICDGECSVGLDVPQKLRTKA